MYSQASTLGYRHVSVDGNNAEAFLGICHAGENKKNKNRKDVPLKVNIVVGSWNVTMKLCIFYNYIF